PRASRGPRGRGGAGPGMGRRSHVRRRRSAQPRGGDRRRDRAGPRRRGPRRPRPHPRELHLAGGVPAHPRRLRVRLTVPLLCALHDVAPPHLPAIRALRDRLRARGVAAATLRVVPRYHGEALERSPETVAWLRAQAAAGDEICLHGFHHRETAPLVGWLDRARAALFTAGEGECLATPAFAPLLRAGRALVEDLVGTAVRGFVAPA